MSPKEWTRSRTVWANAAVTTAGLLVTLAAIFDQLGQVLDAIDLAALPEDIAAWFGGIIALVSAVNIVLRLLTGQAITGTPAGNKAASFASWSADAEKQE